MQTEQARDEAQWLRVWRVVNDTKEQNPFRVAVTAKTTVHEFAEKVRSLKLHRDQESLAGFTAKVVVNGFSVDLDELILNVGISDIHVVFTSNPVALGAGSLGVMNNGIIINGSVGPHAAFYNGTDLSKEVKAARQQYEAWQCEVACDPKFIFLNVTFVKQMQAACEATVSIVDKSHGEQKVTGTGFLVPGGYVMTCMHNFDSQYHKRARTSNWRSGSVEWSEQEIGMECVRTLRDEREFVIDFEKGDRPLDGTRLLVKGDAVWVPHLDVALIKVHALDGQPLPRPMTLRSETKWKTSNVERKVEGQRCFTIGHPAFSDGKALEKVVSLQKSNFIFKLSDDKQFVQYFTDTHGGFSGAPVLVWNKEESKLEVAAVHQRGVRLLEADESDRAAVTKLGLQGYNEGALVTSVMAWLERRHHNVWQAIINSP